jgi:putative FmdB family regulatory protein
MPTYEYRCPDGHEFELFQRISDEPGAACPECGRQAERMLSAGAGLLFKGEGFYITDYRSDSYRKAASAEGEGGARGESASTEKKGSGGEASSDSSSGKTSASSED